MRMPELRELDLDQRNIYTKTPKSGPILVTGPPGTGKTILAFHRSVMLASSGQKVQIIMFNNVLKRFASNTDGFDLGNVDVSTMHSWVPKWFRGAMGSYPPKIGPYKFDWRKMLELIDQANDVNVLRKLDWGHLVIDEGQDFPPDMYRTLSGTRYKLEDAGIDGAAVSVFADDNQSITDDRSSVEQIRNNLNIKDDENRFWRVHKNYRNNKEIAEFSRYFQVRGAQSARLPDKESGVQPSVMMTKPKKGNLDTIKQIVKNRPIEIGVIVLGTSYDVESIYTSMKNRLNGSDILLQGYIGGPKKNMELKDHGALKFDVRPSVTIVHKNSCKGLEFDTVFVMLAEKLVNSDMKELQSFRDLYVACSRAREELKVCFGTPSDGPLPSAVGFMPKPEKKLCRYFGDSTTETNLSQRLGQFKYWKDSIEVLRDRVSQELSELGIERILSKLDIETVKRIVYKFCDKSYKDHVDNFDGSIDSFVWVLIETHQHTAIRKIADQMKAEIP